MLSLNSVIHLLIKESNNKSLYFERIITKPKEKTMDSRHTYQEPAEYSEATEKGHDINGPYGKLINFNLNQNPRLIQKNNFVIINEHLIN